MKAAVPAIVRSVAVAGQQPAGPSPEELTKQVSVFSFVFANAVIRRYARRLNEDQNAPTVGELVQKVSHP